jgi:hypothetical protein
MIGHFELFSLFLLMLFGFRFQRGAGDLGQPVSAVTPERISRTLALMGKSPGLGNEFNRLRIMLLKAT